MRILSWVEYEVPVELLPLSSSLCRGHDVLDMLDLLEKNNELSRVPGSIKMSEYWVEYKVPVELLPLASTPSRGHEVFDILNIGLLSQNWILDFGDEYWVKLAVLPLSSSPCQGHEVFDILNIGY